MGGGQGLCHHLTTHRTVSQSQRVTCDRASVAPRLRNSELRVLPPTVLLIHVKSTCRSAVWECQMPLESLSQFELETENGKESEQDAESASVRMVTVLHSKGKISHLFVG